MTAHRFALENNKIKADMIESSVFPHLAVKYNVQSVPKIIINEETELVGAQSIDKFLEVLEKI
jgi:predicted DsbA family dithiol-disulfide isomerase